MSDRVQSPNRPEAAAPPRTPKQERRAAAKAAAAQAAAARARRQRITGVFAGLAVVAVFITVFVVFDKRDSDKPDETASAPGPAVTTEAATTPGFPPLPEGADPALGSKPEAKAGSGELAKLTVTPLIEGTGPAAQAGQQITVNYVGVSYRTGEEFDASWNRSEPFAFQLGAGNVIQGWDQGLVGVKVGSRVALDIPSEQAYGDDPNSGRPTGPLRFIVDLLAVQ